MAGLFEKDIRLVLHRKQSLIMFFAIALLMGISQDDGGIFVIGYMTMLGTIFTISTFSYDEFDNGLPFLMTLPISQRIYVTEKYLFTIITGLLSWLISLVIAFSVNILKGTATVSWELMISALTILPVIMILLSIMIPIQLKYGAEKSRVALLVLGGGAVAAALVATRFVTSSETGMSILQEIAEKAQTVSMGIFIVLMFVTVAAAMLLSMKISTGIMERKEY